MVEVVDISVSAALLAAWIATVFLRRQHRKSVVSELSRHSHRKCRCGSPAGRPCGCRALWRANKKLKRLAAGRELRSAPASARVGFVPDPEYRADSRHQPSP